MASFLITATVFYPLLLALGLVTPLRRLALALVPTAALPALTLAGFSGAAVDIPWLLLGATWGVDASGVALLLLAGLLWTAAAVFAHGYLADDPERVRFYAYFLLTLAGNLGTFIALDMASFYFFFTLMSLASYGLIAHDGSAEALRAGRVYMVLAIVGEALLLMAVALIAARWGNVDLRELGARLAAAPDRDWIMALAFTGFAIKMGVVPLHVWLPLAHPYAPTPASAVLSGVILKAGLMGWLRFLPLGELAAPGWAALCLTFGIGSAFYAVLAGLPQAKPKTVLAYSSVSQMGLATGLLGIGFAAPQSWPLVLGGLLLFALNHGLAKGALFLGVGVADHGGRWAGWVLAIPALAIAGAPLSGGALAKLAFKETTPLAPGDWAYWLPLLLTLSSLATSLLLARFLYLVWPRQRQRSSPWLWLPWAGLVVASLLLPWWWAAGNLPKLVKKVGAPEQLYAALWPLLAAAGIAFAVWLLWRLSGFYLRLPEGDILQPLSRWFRAGSAAVRVPRDDDAPAWFYPGSPAPGKRLLERYERRLRRLGSAGLLMLLLALALFVLLLGG